MGVRVFPFLDELNLGVVANEGHREIWGWFENVLGSRIGRLLGEREKASEECVLLEACGGRAPARWNRLAPIAPLGYI